MIFKPNPLNTFAYCAASFRRFVARAAGVPSPTTCPPTTMASFDPTLLQGRDLVWLKLHGLQGQPYWYGDHHTTALSARQLAQADLEGAVVFVANCWLADDEGQPGPMLHALARANPRAVIGGSGTNYALANRLGGTDLLGLYLRFFLQIGFVPSKALRLAKVRLMLRRRDKITSDTLAFRLWIPDDAIGGATRERETAGEAGQGTHCSAPSHGAAPPGKGELAPAANRRHGSSP